MALSPFAGQNGQFFGNGGVSIPAFNFPGNSGSGAMADNNQWAPRAGDASQIFQGMLGANQGIPNMMGALQLNGVNQFGNNMQGAMGQIGQQNQANQGAAMGAAGMRNQANMARMGDVAGLDSSLFHDMYKLPIAAGLMGALTGGAFGGGGLRGFSNTNGPQAASLPPGVGGGAQAPGTFGGGALFNAIMGADPFSKIQGMQAGGLPFHPFDAFANPEDRLRQLQGQNLNAAMHFGPNGQAGARAGQVDPGSIF